MNDDTFIKLFDIDGLQVAVIDRGEGDEGCWNFEQVTKLDGITVAATIGIPIAKSEEFFKRYAGANAEAFLKAAREMLK